jgi:hypothetical protein
MKPSYDPDVLADYFQPIGDALWADPVLGPVLRRLAEADGDLIAAVADVDRSQIRDALALSPDERLANAFAGAATLEGYRRAQR